jgi:hypothetical protein
MQIGWAAGESPIIAKSCVVDYQYLTRPIDRIYALSSPIRSCFPPGRTRKIARLVDQGGWPENRPRIRSRKVAYLNLRVYSSYRLYEGFPNSRGSPCYENESYPFQTVLNCAHKAGPCLLFTETIKYDPDYE